MTPYNLVARLGFFQAFLCLLFSFSFAIAQSQTPPSQKIDAVTFADDKAVYVPLQLAADDLGLAITKDPKTKREMFGDKKLSIRNHLFDGTPLLSIDALQRIGVQTTWDAAHRTFTLVSQGHSAVVAVGDKRVVIDVPGQKLNAYQGDTLVFSTHVSTGKLGKSTPPGSYKAGPVKERMHYSKLYNNAPMPYSVQVNNDIFIHGFKSVPKKPASHGCIRVPIPAAKWFYSWIEVGDPVTISGRWAPPQKAKPTTDTKSTKK